jgi:hypothetical protein
VSYIATIIFDTRLKIAVEPLDSTYTSTYIAHILTIHIASGKVGSHELHTPLDIHTDMPFEGGQMLMLPGGISQNIFPTFA